MAPIRIRRLVDEEHPRFPKSVEPLIAPAVVFTLNRESDTALLFGRIVTTPSPMSAKKVRLVKYEPTAGISVMTSWRLPPTKMPATGITFFTSALVGMRAG